MRYDNAVVKCFVNNKLTSVVQQSKKISKSGILIIFYLIDFFCFVFVIELGI